MPSARIAGSHLLKTRAAYIQSIWQSAFFAGMGQTTSLEGNCWTNQSNAFSLNSPFVGQSSCLSFLDAPSALMWGEPQITNFGTFPPHTHYRSTDVGLQPLIVQTPLQQLVLLDVVILHEVVHHNSVSASQKSPLDIECIRQKHFPGSPYVDYIFFNGSWTGETMDWLEVQELEWCFFLLATNSRKKSVG